MKVTRRKRCLIVIGALLGVVPASAVAQQSAARTVQPPPNIVIMYPDNLGYGEVAIYGGNRGVPTPRIDALSREGLRLTNFNVETFCTPSRAALLTGRYGIRTGTLGYRPPWSGMTLWEITLAELVKPLGYATALFGKWHVGNGAGRAPTNQGFDEWYGIRDSSNEAQGSTMGDTPYIWEGRAGEPSRPVKEFNLDTRRTIDREVTERGIVFMERSVKAEKPFFLYLPFTLIHFPTLPHHEFQGTTGAGDIGDAMAEMDRNVGVVLDAIARLGVAGNTIVIWASDGGAEARRPWRGTAGPWRGFYNTAMEGGIRTPFMIRWPGRIPAGQVSNEIVHNTDVFTTLAHALGVQVPNDRAIDGVNQLPFFEGRQKHSNRQSFLYFAQNGQVRVVKWRDWKLHYVWQDEPGTPVERTMKLFHLRSDPKEETDIKDANPWVPTAINKIVADFWATTDTYPLIPVGTPDPYEPPPAASRRPRPAIGETVTTPSGLSYVFTKQGTGPRTQPGDLMIIHGIGRFPDGTEFWNTRTEGSVYEYTLGVDRVIRGFEEGMREAREGDRMVITMKPELAYGERGNRDIPPNATLIFDYEVLAVEPLSIGRLLREGIETGGLDAAIRRAAGMSSLGEYYVSVSSVRALASAANRQKAGDGEKVLAFGLTLLPNAHALHQALAREQAERGAIAEAVRSYEAALRLNPKTTAADRRDFDAATQALALLRKQVAGESPPGFVVRRERQSHETRADQFDGHVASLQNRVVEVRRGHLAGID
jgi:arylsulfatase